MPVTKQQGILGALVVAASAVTAGGTLWGFTEKVFGTEIREQLTPILQTQLVLLESDIDNRRLGIAAMEFKRDMCAGAECWSLRDAQDLSRARAELVARENALSALRAIQ